MKKLKNAYRGRIVIWLHFYYGLPVSTEQREESETMVYRSYFDFEVVLDFHVCPNPWTTFSASGHEL